MLRSYYVKIRQERTIFLTMLLGNKLVSLWRPRFNIVFIVSVGFGGRSLFLFVFCFVFLLR